MSEFVPADVDRDELILEHMPLLRHIVGRMYLDVPGCVEREDLLGWGMLGLIAAADSWDPSRGLRFSTYAYPKIRGAVLDELRRQDFLPRSRRERLRVLDKAVAELEQELGMPPSPEQLAKALETSIDEIDELFHAARVAGQVSLESGPSEGFAQLLVDPTSSDPVGSAEFEEMKVRLVEAIKRLPEQEELVITMYYGEDLLLRDIAAVLDVTESRVSQIHSRALYRLNRDLVS